MRVARTYCVTHPTHLGVDHLGVEMLRAGLKRLSFKPQALPSLFVALGTARWGTRGRDHVLVTKIPRNRVTQVRNTDKLDTLAIA